MSDTGVPAPQGGQPTPSHAGVPKPDENHPSTYGDDDEPATPVGSDGGATHALAKLIRQTPFTDLHNRTSGDPKWRRYLCFVIDALLTLAAYALLLAIIGAVAWKTLAPFPRFWQ